MASTIWNAIAIIVGYMILIPLLILVVIITCAFIKVLMDKAIVAGAEFAEWIEEKLKK